MLVTKDIRRSLLTHTKATSRDTVLAVLEQLDAGLKSLIIEKDLMERELDELRRIH